MSWNNQNGLINGDIPAGKPCPFLNQCSLKSERCPTPDKLRSYNYSCAAARAQSLMTLSDNNILKKIFLKNNL